MLPRDATTHPMRIPGHLILKGFLSNLFPFVFKCRLNLLNLKKTLKNLLQPLRARARQKHVGRVEIPPILKGFGQCHLNPLKLGF